MARLLIATALAVAVPTTAQAFQTEVDPGMMAWKREGLARWVREQRKAAWIDRVEAAQEAETQDVHIGSYPAGVLSAAQVAAYARGAGFPESVIPTMVAIAYRESRFDPGAVNPSGATGLWQIYPGGPQYLDPAANAAAAFAKYQASGLAPWGM